MKYCVHCGAEILDDAVFCVNCGRSAEQNVKTKSSQNETLSIIIKVFLIVGCVSQCWLLVPMLWCLPITISIFKSLRDNRPIGIGMKICALVLVNLIAGICLLVMNDDNR